MRTDTKAMQALYDALAETAKHILEEGCKKVVDGEVLAVTPDAATLNMIRQLLKDAGVVPIDAATPDILKSIRDRLPFDGSEHRAGDDILQ